MNPDLLFDFPASARQGRHATAWTGFRQWHQIAGVLLLLIACLLLTGCSTNPNDVTAMPNPVDFGTVWNGRSKDATVSVVFSTNATYGTSFIGPITGTSIAVSGTNSGDFQIVSQTCIGNTGAQSAVIRFTPAAIGSRSATLTIVGTSRPVPFGNIQMPITYTRTVALTGNAITPLAASLAGAMLRFDGVSSRVTVPHNNALNVFPFTVEAWVNSKQGGDATLVSKSAPGGANGWQMSLHNGLVSAAYLRDSNNYVGDGGAYTFTSGGSVADGQWHHVAFVVDLAGGRLYVDGVLQNTLVWTGTPGLCSATQNVTFGASVDGSSAYMGQMDEVRLWNVARTSAQIQVNARATQRENEPGLLACYRLDEGKGTAIADATANRFNGTLSGAGVWTNSLAPLDAVIVAPGQPRAFSAAGFDVDGNALAFTPTSYPAQGTLSVHSPTLTYAPGASFTSVDTFTYTASNGTAVSSPTTVRLLYRVAGANTLYVPAQYATLQAAIDASGTGDTILVANGTYTGAGNISVDFRGKGLTLRSVGGAAACIIDCQQKGRAFYLGDGETGASRIDGFTIQNGKPDDVSGGGVYASNSNPTVANCLFLNNTADKNNNNQHTGYGGGMYGGTALNCTFAGNSAASGGGGIYNGTATVNCTFTGNSTNASGGGMVGGTATNCVFTGNKANLSSSNMGGGGMVGGTALNCTFTGNYAYFGGGVDHCSATNCLFSGNSAIAGGGLSNSNLVVNCTIIGNAANGGGGGGMYCTDGVFTITNCILWGNTAQNDFNQGDIGPQIWNNGVYFSPTINVTNCDVQGGWPGIGNINADPLFVNAAGGDVRLMPSSPCIDAGTMAGVTLPPTDLDGMPRILGNAPDMGAYEFVSRRCVGKLVFEGIVARAAPQNVRFQLRPLNGAAPIELTALVPASGEFSFGLPAQPCTLWIKSDRYLAVSVPLPNGPNDVVGLAPLLRAGDANNDNSVDVFDFTLLSQSYFLSVGDAGYDARADFNGDGTVDIFDYVLLAQNYFVNGDS